MAAWASGVLLLVTVTVVAGSCPAGRYGYSCSYQCHCPQDNCNPTSGCHPANCSRGWSGPTCQKENVALNKTTSSSGVYFSPSNAVNGDTRGDDENRCYHSAYDDNTITSTWWRVDLGETTLVHDVIIYFRTNFKVRRNGIQMYIADTDASPTDGVNCYSVTGNRNGTDTPDVLKVTCSGEGRYLVLYTTTPNGQDKIPVLDFCEVEVEVCAPGTFGADCDNYCHCDGDVCNYVSGICPSGVCLPGWQTDRCYTGCYVGSYGTNCTKLCSDRHCKGDSSSCDRVTGHCAEGCEAGWHGTDCTQECVNSYGEDCAYQCSSRKCDGISSCNHVTGTCERGCVPGWKNVDCTEACVLGVEYGANCSGNCSARMCGGVLRTCPQDTGLCESGCRSGWKGEDCTQACVQGTEYGVGCLKTCNTRMCQGDASTCPRDTGRCTDGCQTGWKGDDCTTECVQGREYGVGCHKNCSTRMCQRDVSTCPRDTGRCTDGCQAGWKGDDCTTVLKSFAGTETGKISPLAAGFVGAVAMLVVLAVVAGVVCLWRRGDFRMAKPSSKESGTLETSPAEPVEVPTYDVLPEHDYTKLDRIHTEHCETLQPTVHYQNVDVSN